MIIFLSTQGKISIVVYLWLAWSSRKMVITLPIHGNIRGAKTHNFVLAIILNSLIMLNSFIKKPGSISMMSFRFLHYLQCGNQSIRWFSNDFHKPKPAGATHFAPTTSRTRDATRRRFASSHLRDTMLSARGRPAKKIDKQQWEYFDHSKEKENTRG